MRNQSEWALVHRAGRRRARAIVERQDRIIPHSLGSQCIVYKQDRESSRRKKQIDRGYLKVENGLVV